MAQYEKSYEDDVFLVELTFLQDKPFIHVSTKRKLTVTDVKRGREVFKEIRAALSLRGYAFLYAATPSVDFAKLICPNYEFVQTVNKELDLIVWELKQQP